MKQKNNIKIIAIFLCMILHLSMLFSCNNDNTDTIRETFVEDTYSPDTPVQDTLISDTFVQETIVYDTSVAGIMSEAKDGIGGNASDDCIHDMLDENGFVIDDPFYESYHTITGVILTYVGDEAADKWLKDKWSDPENLTIITFLNEFGVTYDQLQIFNKMVGSVYYRCDYNPDILYSKDVNKINSYYSINAERQLRYYKNIFMFMLKANLKSYIKNELNQSKQYQEWINEKVINTEERYFDFSGVESSDKIMETILGTADYTVIISNVLFIIL